MLLERSRHAQPKRIIELDGLRAFAIIPVLMVHTAPHEGSLSFLRPAFEAGWIGVDLFFVLSGFLITGILLENVGKGHYYRNFIVRRALRILPLYYSFLVIVTATTFFARDSSQWKELLSWGNPAWFALYAGNINIALKAAFPPLGSLMPLWSLQVEEQFYIFYPLLVALCTRSTLRRVLMACVLVAPLIRGAGMLAFPGNWQLCYVLTPCRMDALGMGALVALLMRDSDAMPSKKVLKLSVAAGGLACIGLFCLVSNSGSHPFHTLIGFTLLDLTFAALLMLVVSLAGTPAMAGLRWRPLVYTGQIAYGLYLLHGPASALARRAVSLFLPVAPNSTLNIPLTFIASFILAGVSWRFFESPILALKERYTRSPDERTQEDFALSRRVRSATSSAVRLATTRGAAESPK
jgi:peptidoglycan/LPS O-acetylase OafA/YrhL